MLTRRFRSLFALVLLIAIVVPLWVTPVEAAYGNTYKNTGNMRNDIIGVALTQVGYKEGSNNYTKYGVWYGLPNSPWCGMFVSWCAKEAGVPTSVLKRTGIANPKNFGLSYKSGTKYTPKKGDLFFKKSFTHVGFVYYVDGAYFYTIEGNTSNTGSQGDRVLIRRRKISDFYFSSPDYSGSGKDTTKPTGCSHKYKTKVETAHPHKQYKICTKCDKKSYTGKKVSSDSCKTCIQAKCDHKYSEWKKANDNKHSRICTKCDKKQTKEHDWVEGKILKAATCVDKGSLQLICSDCGAKSSKSIDATGKHSFGAATYIDENKHQKVCSVCNLQKDYDHRVNKKWDHDVIYHWNTCTDCDGRLDHTEHVFSDGCLSACAICGYTMEDGHKVTGEFKYDENHHWQICVRCNQDADIQSHTYTSDCDETCNACGYTRSGAADHTDVYHSDETGHWRECTTCCRMTPVVSHTLDRNCQEWEDQRCIQCQYVLRSAEDHEHTLHTIFSDENTHWGACDCGEEIAPEVHIWDIQTGCCSICNAEYVDPSANNGSILAAFWDHILSTVRS